MGKKKLSIEPNERVLFGTDGIRGKANVYPMTCEVAMSLGRAVTHYFQGRHKNKVPLIIIGKDTRLSCYMLEQAFSSGVCSQGGRAILTGPLPTPGVSFVTQSMRADAGVMISASHNNYSDNGIKIFDNTGHKLPDDVERELEDYVLNPEKLPIKLDKQLGRAKRLDEVYGRYIVYVKSAFSSQYNLEGMRLVVDSAHGAAYKVAPMVFEELGADVVPICASPNGQNINLNCGALHPETCAESIRLYRGDLGICLDGDADRCVIVDETGEIINGDQLIGLFARFLKDSGELKKNTEIVGTVMSNIGVQSYIESLGLQFYRTQVGDRYLLERMKESGALFGGEPSGHLIFRKHSASGDGILTALKVIEVLKFYGQNLKQLIKEISLFPQVLKNVQVSSKPALEDCPNITKQIKLVEQALGTKGRVLLRYSGTEPLVRVMVEGEDEVQVRKHCQTLAEIVARELGE